MDRFLRLNFSFLRYRISHVVLAFAWIAGLLFGGYLSLSANTFLSVLMRTAVTGSMSIFGLLAVLLLPLLLSAFVVCFLKVWILIPIAFLKAFLFSFTAVGLMVAFGTAGWLIRCLLMFSDCLILPLLWFFWIHALSDKKEDALHYCIFACSCALLIVCFDYYTVAPFLASLILF